MRSASSARRRSEPPALTSRAGGPRLRDGGAHPRATKRNGTSYRHLQPGNRMEAARSRPRPQRRSSGSSAGVTTEASTAPAHSQGRRRRDPHRSERRLSSGGADGPARAPSSPSQLVGGVSNGQPRRHPVFAGNRGYRPTTARTSGGKRIRRGRREPTSPPETLAGRRSARDPSVPRTARSFGNEVLVHSSTTPAD
jgi:hypothetical protein